MRPVRQSITAIGPQPPVVLDYIQPQFKVSFQVSLNGAAMTYGVEYSFDDPFGTETPNWTPDANVGTGPTTDGVGNYFFPVTMIRVNNPGAPTGGTPVFTVIQGGPGE